MPRLAPPLAAAALAVITAVITAALTACGGSPEAPPGPPPETLATHMRIHFAHAIALREVVVAGDLSLLAIPADALGRDTGHPDLPPSAAPFVERMNLAARRAGDARTLGQATAAVADVAATCGACHGVHGVTLAPSAPDALSETIDAEGHMQRHHWAAAKLWDGLVRPSWEDWKTGADALSEAPLFPEHLTAGGAGPETAPLIAALHDAGRRALSVEAEGRAAVFADVIATCAGCHSRRER